MAGHTPPPARPRRAKPWPSPGRQHGTRAGSRRSLTHRRSTAHRRVTLYGHFTSREQLITAALDRAVAEVGAVLDDDTLEDVPADEALSRLIASSWRVLDSHRMLFEAAQRSIDHARLRRHHDPAMARFDKLIARGQAEGRFRTDLTRGWLLTIVYTLLHAAAEEVNAGRMRPAEAADILRATVLPALAPSLPSACE